MCALAPEKSLRPVYGSFNLAIFTNMTDCLRVHQNVIISKQQFPVNLQSLEIASFRSQ